MSARLHGLRGLSALGLSTVVAKGAWFAFLVVGCGRLLATGAYGALLTALSLATLAAALVEGGFYVLAARFALKSETDGFADLSRLLTLRLLAGLATLGVSLVVALAMGWESALLHALLGAVLYVTGLGVRGVLRALLEVRRRLSAEAGFLLLERSTCIGAALAALWLWEPSARAVLLGLSSGQVVTCAAQLAWMRAQGLGVAFARPSRRWSLSLARSSLLVALTGMMNTFYARSDQILVERLLGPEAAGSYGMMYQVLLAMGMFTTLFTDSYLYPRFAAWYCEGRVAQLRRVAAWSSAGLVAVGLAAVALVRVAAGWAFATAGLDRYLAALPILHVLVWAFPLYGVHLVLNAALLAAFHERGLLVALSLGAAVSVTGVLAMAPQGLAAVASVTVLTELVVVVASGLLYLYVFHSHRAASRPL